MSNAAPGFEAHSDHAVDIEEHDGEVVVRIDESEIARTRNALILSESHYEPVFYIPLEDVAEGMTEKSDHSTYCPFKGDASYWHIKTVSGKIENAIWGYESPYDECRLLKDHVAFYPDKVAITAQ